MYCLKSSLDVISLQIGRWNGISSQTGKHAGSMKNVERSPSSAAFDLDLILFPGALRSIGLAAAPSLSLGPLETEPKAKSQNLDLGLPLFQTNDS